MDKNLDNIITLEEIIGLESIYDTSKLKSEDSKQINTILLTIYTIWQSYLSNIVSSPGEAVLLISENIST